MVEVAALTLVQVAAVVPRPGEVPTSESGTYGLARRIIYSCDGSISEI